MNTAMRVSTRAVAGVEGISFSIPFVVAAWTATEETLR